MTTQLYSSHQQTRQQLDDLDALLERMLTLPSGQSDMSDAMAEPMPAESFAPLPPTLPQSYPAARTVNTQQIVQAWRLAPPPAPVEPPMAVAIDAPAAPYPFSLVFGQPMPTEGPVAPAPFAVSTPAPTIAPAWATAVPTPTEVSESTSLVAWPFVIVNRIFDMLTHLLGPLGAWARQPAGRTAIGILGILMILGAIGWGVADFLMKARAK